MFRSGVWCSVWLSCFGVGVWAFVGVGGCFTWLVLRSLWVCDCCCGVFAPMFVVGFGLVGLCLRVGFTFVECLLGCLCGCVLWVLWEFVWCVTCCCLIVGIFNSVG